MALPYDTFGYPNLAFSSPVTLGTGGTMTFQGGDGVTVPEFDVVATIPGTAVITSPVPTTDGGAATIDSTKDLSVAWPAISIGQVNFELNSGNSNVGSVVGTIACTFPGTPGVAWSSRHFASMKQLSAGTSTCLSLSSELTVTTVVDGLTIVTESYQDAPGTVNNFNVALE